MVFSCVGGNGGRMILSNTLFPFHNFNCNFNPNNNNIKNKLHNQNLLLILGSSKHFSSSSSSSSSAGLLPQSLHTITTTTTKKKKKNKNSNGYSSFIFCCSTSSSTDNFSTSTSSTAETTSLSTTSTISSAPPLLRKRKRYRKLYPGESLGIVEEMRFVAMKLRNNNNNGEEEKSDNEKEKELEDKSDGETWHPTIEGFLKYLVNSKLVFETLERVVYESDHVAYTYFRKTGLERSEGLAKDLEWFEQQNFLIPQPSNPGVSYAEYLEDLAEKSAPLFLCHFYNIYFAHISGGQVIAKQVSDRLLEGRDLEFYRWEGDVPMLLKDVRENLNKLGEHWTRDEKNKCLREAAKSFRFLGQIVRLIIL